MYASQEERGVAAVEFALIVPLLVLILFGIVEGGTRYTQQNQANHWAYLTARYLSIDPTKSASTFVTGLKGSDTHVFDVQAKPVAPNTELCTSPNNNKVMVTITSERTSPSGMFGSYTIKGTAVALCEN